MRTLRIGLTLPTTGHLFISNIASSSALFRYLSDTGVGKAGRSV